MTATAYASDVDLLRAILTAAPFWEGEGWLSHDFILAKARYLTSHGMTVHSRAADLRKPPHNLNVECKVERKNGRAVSFYRLVP